MKNLIKKCLDELNKKAPSLDYIRGLLEAMAEMQGLEIKPQPEVKSEIPAQVKDGKVISPLLNNVVPGNAPQNRKKEPGLKGEWID